MAPHAPRGVPCREVRAEVCGPKDLRAQESAGPKICGLKDEGSSIVVVGGCARPALEPARWAGIWRQSHKVAHPGRVVGVGFLSGRRGVRIGA